jgi:hypothetical protein
MRLRSAFVSLARLAVPQIGQRFNRHPLVFEVNGGAKTSPGLAAVSALFCSRRGGDAGVGKPRLFLNRGIIKWLLRHVHIVFLPEFRVDVVLVAEPPNAETIIVIAIRPTSRARVGGLANSARSVWIAPTEENRSNG